MRVCGLAFVIAAVLLSVSAVQAEELAATTELPAALRAIGASDAPVVNVDKAKAVRGEGYFPDFLAAFGSGFKPSFLVAGENGSFPNFLGAGTSGGYFPDFLTAGTNGGFSPDFLQAAGSGKFPNFLQSK